MATREKDVTFTPRDFELLAGALKSVKSEIVVDYSKMAATCQLKSGASAKASWHSLKKKIDKMDPGASIGASLTITPSATAADGDGDAASEPRTKAKGGRKRKNMADSEEEDDDGPSPAKKGKGKLGRKAPIAKTGKGKGAKSTTAVEDGDDDEDTPAAAQKLVDTIKGEPSGDESD